MSMERDDSNSIEVRHSTRLDFKPEDNFRIEQSGELVVSRLVLQTTGKFNNGELYIEQGINGNGISVDQSRGLGGNVGIIYSTSNEENGPKMVRMQPQEAQVYT